MIRFIKSHIFGSYDGLRKQDRGISKDAWLSVTMKNLRNDVHNFYRDENKYLPFRPINT